MPTGTQSLFCISYRIYVEYLLILLLNYRLSERNCIEIVSKLIELKLVDVYFTNDGKEYVTPQQLSKEMSEELFMHGGRINLTELVPLLNISYHAIEARAQDIIQSRPDVHLISGQLIDDDYLNHICEEINEALQQNGQISVADLTKQYELSADFLLQQLVSRLGGIVQGQQDKNNSLIFFTEGFLARKKACIRGTLSAITVPTPVSSIISQNKFPERLFFAVAEELIASKRIKGSLAGGRQAGATYVPEIYSRSQSEWIDNFFKQNGYLEFDALTRLGIQDPKGYCRKRFKDTSLLYLSTCCVGSYILEQIEAAIDEALSSHSWLEIMPLLPSVFDEEDALQMIQDVLKNRKNKEGGEATVIGNAAVASDQFVQKLRVLFDPVIQEKATEVVQSGLYLQAQADLRNKQKIGASRQSAAVDAASDKKDRKEERRKKANEGKGGGGTQGRETKTKSTKKKYLRGKNDSDDEADDDNSVAGANPSGSVDLEFLSVGEIGDVLKKQESLNDAPDDLINELANRLYRPLQLAFHKAARLAFEALLSSSSGHRRRTHGELQDRLQTLLQSIKQGEKALQHFSSVDTQQLLARHLLKTTASDLVSELVLYIAQDSNVVMETKDLTPEVRLKLIGDMPQNVRGPLQAVHKATQGPSVDEFFTATDAALAACDVVLRRPDKKKDKSLSSTQRHSLIEQLNSATDAALVLHVAVLLLFHTCTQTMLIASGRFVPQIVTFLQPHLTPAAYESLTTLQGLVIQELTAKGDEEQLVVIRQRMEELMPVVRETAVVFKKSAANDDH
nr:EOG090X0267 [Sida crystallina]